MTGGLGAKAPGRWKMLGSRGRSAAVSWTAIGTTTVTRVWRDQHDRGTRWQETTGAADEGSCASGAPEAQLCANRLAA